MGANPMEVVAKSIERPEELTLAELQIMDMYLIGAINELRRLEVLQEAGLDVGASVEGLENFYFGSNFAKAWYERYGYQREPLAVQEKIDAVSPDFVVDFFDGVLDDIGTSGGQQLSRDSSNE